MIIKMTNVSTDKINKIKSKLIHKGILPLSKQSQLSTEILKERLDKILPSAMKSTNIDTWIIISKEYGEDPIFNTFTTWDMPRARRLNFLIFKYDKETNRIQSYSIGITSPEMNKIYQDYKLKEEKEWITLNRLLNELNPNVIGLNFSDQFGQCDGISYSIYEKFAASVDENFVKKVTSANELAVKWLAQMTPIEIDIMKTLVEVTHDIIRTVFNKEFIKIGETTTTEIEWEMREIIAKLNCDYWFGPDVDLQRKGVDNPRIFNTVIQEGDLLHCDIGLNCKYLNLNTDIQWLGYIRKENEKQVPHYLKKLMEKCNDFQDIVIKNINSGITGNEVLSKSLSNASTLSVKPMLYTHPIGTFGHGVGPNIGLFNNQVFVEGTGERTIENNTCYALELNVSDEIKEWDNQRVYIFLEEDICYKDKVFFLSNRQEEILLI